MSYLESGRREKTTTKKQLILSSLTLFSCPLTMAAAWLLLISVILTVMQCSSFDPFGTPTHSLIPSVRGLELKF